MVSPSPDAGFSPTGAAASCKRCKKRKARCDRQYPACQRCLDANVTCEYLARRRPGFPSGHRQTLEAQIKRLENEVHGLRRAATSTPPSREHPPAGPGVVETPSQLSQMPAPPSLRDGTDDADGVLAATYKRTAHIVERVPPADLVYSMTSLFFRHIHPLFPFLGAQPLFDDMGSQDEPSLLSYALFGVSLPFSFDSRLDQRSSDSFWKYLKRRIFIEILEEPSYSSLEALAVLLLDISGMTNGPQVWGSLAVAARLAVQLRPIGGRGVLRLSTHNTDEDFPSAVALDQTPRLRLFWFIYAIDCYITLTTSHESELANSHILPLLPTRDATWSDRPRGPVTAAPGLTPMSAFRHQLALLDMSRELHLLYLQYVNLTEEGLMAIGSWYRDVAECLGRMSAWAKSLPPSFGMESPEQLRSLSAGVLGPVCMLQGLYHALVIHMNGLVAFPPTGALESQLSWLQAECQQSCAQSVLALLRISEIATAKVPDKLAWPFAWCLWVAGRYLITEGRHGFHDRLEYLKPLRDRLAQLGRYWQLSRKYLHLLKEAEAELDPRTPQSNLSRKSMMDLIVDLRVPTSDLEDYARRDPLLLGLMTATTEGLSPGTMQQQQQQQQHQQDTFQDDSIQTHQHRADVQAGIGPDDPTAENWFSMPLFPFSGYAQSRPDNDLYFPM